MELTSTIQHPKLQVFQSGSEQSKKNILFLEKDDIQVPKVAKKFSLLQAKNKKEIIKRAIATPIQYRNLLDIDPNLGFGIEIEIEDIYLEDLEKLIKNSVQTGKLKYPYQIEKEWTLPKDLEGQHIGGEVVSPIWHNQKEVWQDLKKVCQILRKNQAKITSNCGGHIHVGSEIIEYNENELKKILKFYIVYEHVLFRFFLGDYFEVRDLHWANPIRKKFIEKLDFIETNSIREIKRVLFSKKITAFNIANFDPTQSYKKNTIELRMPNGTLNEKIWQNNINTFIYFLKSLNCPERVDFYLEDKLYQLKKGKTTCYTDIYLEDAFELCDFIFEHEIDKLYFLKQYLHDFQKIQNHYIVSTEMDNKIK